MMKKLLALGAVAARSIDTPVTADRAKVLGDVQRQLATDAAAGFLYQPQYITIGQARLKGLWKDSPVYANDFATWSWQ